MNYLQNAMYIFRVIYLQKRYDQSLAIILPTDFLYQNVFAVLNEKYCVKETYLLQKITHIRMKKVKNNKIPSVRS